MKHLAALFVLCSATAVGAAAQPVYRCGNAYQQTPCSEGRVVDAADARTSEQRADARRMVDGEIRLGERMRRDRLAEEAALKPALASSLGGAPAKPVAEHRRSKKKPLGSKIAPAPELILVAAPPSQKRRGRK